MSINQASSSRIRNRNVINTIRGIPYPETPPPPVEPERQPWLLRTGTTSSHDGEGAYGFTCRQNTPLDYRTEKFSIVFDFKLDADVPSGERILCASSPYGHVYLIWKFTSAGAIKFYKNEDTLIATSEDDGYMNPGYWQNCRLDFDAGKLTLKIDDVAVFDELPFTCSYPQSGDKTFWVMGYYTGYASVNGYVRDVQYLNAHGIVKHHWQCDDGSGFHPTDWIANYNADLDGYYVWEAA